MTKKPDGYEAPLPIAKIYEAPLNAFRGKVSKNTEFKKNSVEDISLDDDDVRHILSRIDQALDQKGALIWPKKRS